MDELLKKAAQFLQENPSLNEVEIEQNGGWRVKVVRMTPTPIIYSGWTYPSITYQWPGQKP